LVLLFCFWLLYGFSRDLLLQVPSEKRPKPLFCYQEPLPQQLWP
jgi:hypothetical protein